MTAQEYAARADDLFVLPQTVTRIKALLEDEASSIDDISNLVMCDPALTAHLLRLANSALYNFPSQIETVSKAVQLIGTQSVYDFTITFGVSQAFKSIPRDVIELDRFWEQSINCALLAKFFADKRGILDSERLFVIGLLHNIGELVMVQFEPEKAVQCTAISDDVTALSLQQDIFGFTYAQVGSQLLRHWGIPESLVSVIEKQHCTLYPSPDVEVNILQLAAVLATENTYHEYFQNHTNLEQRLYEDINLDTDDLEGGVYFAQIQSPNFAALVAA